MNARTLGCFQESLRDSGSLTRERRARRGQPFSGLRLLLCSLLGIIGTLVHSYIDFPLQIASIQFYVCMLLAVCWSAKASSSAVT